MPGTLTITRFDGKSVLMGVYGPAANSPAGAQIYTIPAGQHNIELAYTMVEYMGTSTRTTRGKGIKFSYDFIPGRSYRFSGTTTRGSYSVRILDATDESLLTITPKKKSFLGDMAYSLDGYNIAYTDGTDIVIANAEDGTAIKTITTGKKAISRIQFNTDGKNVISLSQDNNVKVWDINAGTEVRTILASKKAIKNIAFSPDNTRVAVSIGDNIEVYDVNSGQKISTFPGYKSFLGMMLFSSDNSRIISATPQGLFSNKTSITLTEVESGKQINSTTLEFPIGPATWRYKSEKIAVGAGPGVTILDVNTMNVEKTFSVYGGNASGAYYSPDGKYIICINTEPQISPFRNAIFLDAETGKELRTITPAVTEKNFYRAIWNPSGKSFAFVILGKNGIGYQIWDSSMVIAPGNGEIGSDAANES